MPDATDVPLDKRLECLPIVETARHLSEEGALRAMTLLAESNPTLVQLIKDQIEIVTEDVLGELALDDEGVIRTTEDEVKGVVARAALTGAAQVLVPLSRQLHVVKQLENEVFSPNND